MSEHAAHTPTDIETRLPNDSRWRRLPVIAGGIGVAGVAVSIVLGFANPAQFYFSWLVAFMYVLSVALGALFMVLFHYVTRAGWSVVVRRVAENLAYPLPLFALLFAPIALGLHELYHWSHADVVAHDPLLAGKAPYLNATFFFVRAFVYFAVWTLILRYFYRRSVRQDDSGDFGITRRLQVVSGPAIVFLGLTMSFAALDWMMTLNPHWYSTIYGVYYFAGCLIGVFATMSILVVRLRTNGPLTSVVTPEHMQDLGKLLFAFTVFWAYIAFSQFMLMWYANIPEETVWYLARLAGSWRVVTIALMVGHFGLPFLILLNRDLKRKNATLTVLAAWMLIMHFVDIHWLVMPTHHASGFSPHLLDLTTLVGIGGLYLAGFGFALGRARVVPAKDPRLAESLRFENV